MKRILIAVIMLASVQAASAQFYKTDTVPRNRFDPSRIMIGGSLGFTFGDYTFVNISPLIGYRFTPKVAAGININAQYASQRLRDVNNQTRERNNYSIFGGGLFGRFYPIEQFFIHAQPEYNRISLKTTTYYNDVRDVTKRTYGAPSLLLGGGYAQPVGGNSALTIMILYDVLQDKNSPYMNRPIISGGVNIGL